MGLMRVYCLNFALPREEEVVAQIQMPEIRLLRHHRWLLRLRLRQDYLALVVHSSVLLEEQRLRRHLLSAHILRSPLKVGRIRVQYLESFSLRLFNVHEWAGWVVTATVGERSAVVSVHLLGSEPLGAGVCHAVVCTVGEDMNLRSRC